MAGKSSRGRQKIPIKWIEDKAKRSVAFSKRKSGVLKKVSELSTMCGIDMALILFNESGKAFSYGNPTLNVILDRFLGLDPQRVFNSASRKTIEAQKISCIQEMEAKIMNGEAMLKLEEQRAKTLSLEMTNHAIGKWWEQPIKKMTLHQIQKKIASMEKLKMVFEEQKRFKSNWNSLNLLALTSVNQISHK
ncbi:agamous-like MADS-box protein AGL62 [Impatiens glandulifera]|uniref:agamous-like MADS-box protein AGL62 n=1 Tax=Impatiens glandulifera TaxID=253017 RepID=UPI001FB06A16|nr:agamous-like MADS-box protein AGL62 [Impatiens glandulifera]